MSNEPASKRLLRALGEQDRMVKLLSNGALPDTIPSLAKRSGLGIGFKDLASEVSPEQLQQMGNALAGRPPAGQAQELDLAVKQLASGAPFPNISEITKRLLAAVISASTVVGSRADQVRTAADLGAMIRTARKAMGMNQAEFAAHAGVGRRFLSELEGGKASLEFDRVMACAEAAGIDLLARRRGG